MKVWVFNGEGSSFPSGIFDKLELAEQWIQSNRLTGILTEYPLNSGVYEWAITQNFFSPKNEAQNSADFIAKFTSASLRHNHYWQDHKE